MQASLALRGASFELPDGRTLFHSLDLSLHSGLTGLVGPNGVGKTTLARILCGELRPATGTIAREGPVAYFPQRVDPPSMTAAEFLGGDIRWSLSTERLLDGLDLGLRCDRLSGGQWMRLRLATLPDAYLVLDEPTNDLDAMGREALFAFLRGHVPGALVISHDRECLALCGTIVELSNRGLARYGGGWDGYAAARERERGALERALDLAERERDQARIERAEKLERQQRRERRGRRDAARGGMPKILLGGRKRAAQESTGRLDAATLDRAEAAERRAREALRALKVDPVMHAAFAGRPVPRQRLVAEAEGFNLRFGAEWLYPRDLDFAWRGNARVALRGANGSGKSTLLQALLGPTPAQTRGRLRTGELRAARIDQRASALDPARSVFDNTRAASDLPDAELRNGLARFLFAGATGSRASSSPGPRRSRRCAT